MSTYLIAIIGDTHGAIPLALDELKRTEKQLGRKIDQVFSVGDLGLFLKSADWRWVTGPSKHKHYDWTPHIREAWAEWPWPLSTIGGNHEPYPLLREFDNDYFSGKLRYTNAGELPHTIPNFHVYGLSGVFHPHHLQYFIGADLTQLKGRSPRCWEQLSQAVKDGHLSPKRLTYYKEEDIDTLKRLAPHPHILLLHDWPTKPDFTKFSYDRRPEAELVETLQPQLVCCGHHHTEKTYTFKSSQIRALNIIASHHQHTANKGWLLLLEWKNDTLSILEPTPK